jgi:glutaredoxin
MQITLFTKPGCHLCDSVEQTIRLVQRTHPIELAIRNILDDPADFERYQYEIPVVILDGVEIARYRLSEAELIAAINKK